MAWPTQSDYKDALQNPDTAFRDPELQASQVERSTMGMPRARSGAFASVYKMIRGPKATALKLFNFPNDDRASRYQAVSDYLLTLGRKKPASLVKFEYHPEGIRVGKGWYPTLTMEWVKGKSLGEWVREAMERRVPDVASIKAMAESWAALVGEIQARDIAHGDLQHDNVMVVGATPVLVDYDGMCVPALAPADPRKKLEQLEFGKPAYQHPARPAEKLGPHLDHFAAWIILIALRACVAEPGIYAEYNTKTQNENLLFVPEDMANPAGSTLWPRLMRCKDATVSEWAKSIRAALDKPFEEIPLFTLEPPDPFKRLRELVVVVPKDWAAIAAEADALIAAGHRIPKELEAATDPTAGLRELCAARVKNYPAIAAEAARMRKTGKTVPPDLQKQVDNARERLICRDEVSRAAEANNPRGVVTAYKPALLDDWPDANAQVTQARVAYGQVAALDKLKSAAASPGDGKAFVALWDSSAATVTGVPEANEFKAKASEWRKRIAAATAFIKLYTSGTTEKQLADAWANVTAAGVPHPDLKPEHAVRGKDAAQRAPLLERLRAVPTIAAYTSDHALILAWGDGRSLNGCAEANDFATRVTDARKRLALVSALEDAIRTADTGGGEEVIATAAEAIPKGYVHPFADRAAVGRASVKLMSNLRDAAAAEKPSDRKIAAAFDALRAGNPDLVKRLAKVDRKLAEDCSDALKRRKALDEFAKLDSTITGEDEQDKAWQAHWLKHKDILRGRRDSEELRTRLKLAVDRWKAWTELAAALDARELFVLRDLHEQHAELLQNYPPLRDREGELTEILARVAQVTQIEKKLKSPDGNLNEGDLNFLRANHGVFSDKAKSRIVEQVKTRLGSDAKLVAGRPPIQVIPVGRSKNVRATWAWPGFGLVSHCLVTGDGNRTFALPMEVAQHALLKCRVEDHQREGGGKQLLPPPGATRVFVTIWAVVDLGWTTVYGPPLHLGPVMIGGAERW